MTANQGGSAPVPTGRTALLVLAGITSLALFTHVLLEWLFFATKPSFLSALGLREKLLLPGAAALPLVAAALLALALLSLPAALGSGGWGERMSLAAARAVPALILALAVLLLIDNFTHTVFRFGIHTVRGPARHLYAGLAAALAVAAWRAVRNLEGSLRSPRRRTVLLAGAAAVLLFSLAATLAGGRAGGPQTGNAAVKVSRTRPNILLLGSDGLEARHLSFYGYPRETTPFLDGFTREALVCDNAFPNAANTGGSLTSLLTGRLPTRTRVICPPDILRGEDAYRHLPLLLKQLGYRTLQLSVRHYADAADLNLQEGFDQANFRSLRKPGGSLLTAALGQTGGYFLQQMGERIASRLSHVFTSRAWTDPYREVTADEAASHSDGERLEALLSFLAVPDRRPFFAHVHFMGTHGATFAPRNARFSLGKEQTGGWMIDFYDDAIRDFDRDAARIVELLRGRGILDDTIVVLYSDHGMRYSTAVRTPLVFRFPAGAQAGRLPLVAQNLDIAPTLLDALGVEAPDWMEGRSLLRPDPDPCRRVVSATAKPQVRLDNNLWVSLPSPPFYSLGKVSLLAGGRHFSLDLATGRLDETGVELAGGTGTCRPPEPAEARAFLVHLLRSSRFDVSSIATSP